MNKQLLICLSVVFALVTTTANAQDANEAMFGLRWGMSIQEVRSLGVNLTKEKGDRNIDTYTTNSLPKNLSDIEKYSLMFADGNLVKMSAVTKNITNDPTGANGKERFEALKSSLTAKYGNPALNQQSVGSKLFKERDEFYQCLKYPGCGMWAVAYDFSVKMISLELKGLGRGTGFLIIVTEGPGWDKALEKYKASKSKADSDAL